MRPPCTPRPAYRAPTRPRKAHRTANLLSSSQQTSDTMDSPCSTAAPHRRFSPCCVLAPCTPSDRRDVVCRLPCATRSTLSSPPRLKARRNPNYAHYQKNLDFILRHALWLEAGTPRNRICWPGRTVLRVDVVALGSSLSGIAPGRASHRIEPPHRHGVPRRLSSEAVSRLYLRRSSLLVLRAPVYLASAVTTVGFFPVAFSARSESARSTDVPRSSLRP